MATDIPITIIIIVFTLFNNYVNGYERLFQDLWPIL